MSILLAIPCYGGVLSDNTTSGLFQTAKQFERHNIRNELLLISNESLISTGRSNIANFFINNTKHDHIMCIDADIGFQPDDIFKLLEYTTPFITAPYSMKCVPPQYNFELELPIKWSAAKTAVSVKQIGTGFQLIHRSVFDKIAKANPQLRYNPVSRSRQISDAEKKNSYHFYESYIDSINGQIISEDFAFCRRYRDTGGTIWMRTDINLTHNGSHVFNGESNLHKFLCAA